jgi:Ni/Co efflux regulator RcnB
MLPDVALAQSDQPTQTSPTTRPTTRPAQGQRPVGRPPRPDTGRPPPGGRPDTGRPPAGGGGGRPPAGGGGNIQPHPMPTVPVRRPGHGHLPRPRPPNHWRRPTGNHWYWHNRRMNRIRGPAFAWPSGWRYRHWSIGSYLPMLFLTSQFFFDNIQPIGLYPAPPGFRWVRFGNDLFLVDLQTGWIADAAYGVFY